MNLFEYLKNYKDAKKTQTYGEIINGGTDITESMTQLEQQVYNQIKISDRMRLIKSCRKPE
jgi:hypothetical protein